MKKELPLGAKVVQVVAEFEEATIVVERDELGPCDFPLKPPSLKVKPTKVSEC